MSEMKVNNLNVDLIQDLAVVSLFKQGELVVGKTTHTSVSVHVPIGSPGDELESVIRIKAIAQAREALKEALRTLDQLAA